MRELTIKIENLPRNKDVLAAIGYLSTWAFNGYDKVMIVKDHGDDDDPKFPDMIAYYENTVTGQHYVIGAIFSGNAYSFHS